MDEAHIWQSFLPLDESLANTLFLGLSQDEQLRAMRFVFPRDRIRFIIARARLRQILSRYLDCLPEDITFTYNAYGKPNLSVIMPGDIQFNVSHSHSLALYIVTQGYQAGIDVELIENQSDREAIAARFFAPGEIAALQALPPAERPLAFLNGWTRKEALFKAMGMGLSFSLKDCELALDSSAFPKIYSICQDTQQAAQWALYSFTPEDSFIAAAVVQNPKACFIHQTMD